ncbi:hypothetical protein ACFLZ2_06020, partial [Candidatus Margulisiibacteriota bacterium]
MRQRILDVIISEAEYKYGNSNSAAFEVLGDIYCKHGPEEKYLKGRIVEIIFENVNNSDVSRGVYGALLSIHNYIGDKDKDLKLRIVYRALADLDSAIEIRKLCLKILREAYKNSNDEQLKEKIVTSIMSWIKISEGLGDTLTSLGDIYLFMRQAERGVRSDIIDVLCDNTDEIASVKVLIKIYRKLTSSEKELKLKIVKGLWKGMALWGESRKLCEQALFDVYREMKGESIYMQDKLIDLAWENINLDGFMKASDLLILIYTSLSGRDRKSSYMEILFAKMDETEGGVVAINAAGRIFNSLSPEDKGVKRHIVSKLCSKAIRKYGGDAVACGVLEGIYERSAHSDAELGSMIVDASFDVLEKGSDWEVRLYSFSIISKAYKYADDATKEKILKLSISEMEGMGGRYAERMLGFLSGIFNASEPNKREVGIKMIPLALAIEYNHANTYYSAYNNAIRLLGDVYFVLGLGDKAMKDKIMKKLRSNFYSGSSNEREVILKMLPDIYSVSERSVQDRICETVYKVAEDETMGSTSSAVNVLVELFKRMNREDQETIEKTIGILLTRAANDKPWVRAAAVKGLFDMYRHATDVYKEKIVEAISGGLSNEFSKYFDEDRKTRMGIAEEMFWQLASEGNDLKYKVLDAIISVFSENNKEILDVLLEIYRRLRLEDKELKAKIITAIHKQAKNVEGVFDALIEINSEFKPEEDDLKRMMIGLSVDIVNDLSKRGIRNSFMEEVNSAHIDFLVKIFLTLKSEDKKVKKNIVDAVYSAMKESPQAAFKGIVQIFSSLRPDDRELRDYIFTRVLSDIGSVYDTYQLTAWGIYGALEPEEKDRKMDIMNLMWAKKGGEREINDIVTDIYFRELRLLDKGITADISLSIIAMVSNDKLKYGIRQNAISVLSRIYGFMGEEHKTKALVAVWSGFNNWKVEESTIEAIHNIYSDTLQSNDQKLKSIAIDIVFKKSVDKNEKVSRAAFSLLAEVYKNAKNKKLKKKILSVVEVNVGNEDAHIRSNVVDFYSHLDSFYEDKEIRQKVNRFLKDPDEEIRKKVVNMYDGLDALRMLQAFPVAGEDEIKSDFYQLLGSIRINSYEEEKQMLSLTFTGREIFDKYKETKSAALLLLCLSKDKLKELEGDLDLIVNSAINMLQSEKAYRVRVAVGYNLVHSLQWVEEPVKSSICRELFDYIKKNTDNEISMFLQSLLRIRSEYLPEKYEESLKEIIESVLPKVPPYGQLFRPGKTTIKIMACIPLNDVFNDWDSNEVGIFKAFKLHGKGGKGGLIYKKKAVIAGQTTEIVLEVYKRKTWDEYWGVIEDGIADKNVDMIIFSDHAKSGIPKMLSQGSG